MQMFLGAASLAIAASLWTPAAGAACSARGRYCDYPVWAANAFDGKTAGRVYEGHDHATGGSDRVYGRADVRKRHAPRRHDRRYR